MDKTVNMYFYIIYPIIARSSYMYIFVLYVVNMLDIKGVRWQLHYYDNIFYLPSGPGNKYYTTGTAHLF